MCSLYRRIEIDFRIVLRDELSALLEIIKTFDF